MRPINSIKKCNESMNSSKNKLNSSKYKLNNKKSWPFKLITNAILGPHNMGIEKISNNGGSTLLRVYFSLAIGFVKD